MNYHPTNDFVVNLESIYKMIGFANKANAKRTLKNNFVLDEDYKIQLISKDDGKEVIIAKAENLNTKDLGGRAVIRKDDGKFTDETVMLNIDTFKNLCMISKTDKGKEIRKYYVKLENVYNSIIKDDYEKQLIEQKEQLTINFIKDREQLLLESYNKKSIVYLIFISNSLWKFGMTNNIYERLKEHRRDINRDIQLTWCIESKDNLFLENELKEYLSSTNYRKEQVFIKKNGKEQIQTELIEIEDISIIQNKIVEINDYIELDKNIKFKRIQELTDKINKLEAIIKQNTILENKKIEKEKVDKIRIRKAKVNFDKEKLKFINWIKDHIEKTEVNCVLNWIDLLTKFLGYRTSPLISKQFRLYFEEYIKEKFPEIDFKCKGIRFQHKKYNGWKYLVCKN